MSNPPVRDYRRMLYRLDKATRYESIPALVQHMMEETVLDGILELRLITTSSGPGHSSEPSQLRLPPTFISFRREGREVNTVALYGPRTRASSPGTSGRTSSSASRAQSIGVPEFALEVKKSYPPRTTLVWVFSPLVQNLLNQGASTVMFECRSYLATSDAAREAQEARAAAKVAREHQAAAAQQARAEHQRELSYQQQSMYPQQQQQLATYEQWYQWQIAYGQQNQVQQYNIQDPSLYTQQRDAYPAPRNQAAHPGTISPARNSNSAYSGFDATYIDYSYVNQVNAAHEYSHHPSSSTHQPPSVSTHPNSYQRTSATRSSPQNQSKTHNHTPPLPRPEKDEHPATELLTRQAPFKRMVGYAGKQHDGTIAVYELADEVAATAFTDSVPGMGMVGVEVMAGYNRATARNSSSSTTWRL